MENNTNVNEQMKVEAQPVQTEEEIKGEESTVVSLGKFKDVNALLNAYNSLQAEFTKRCQRLKELEGEVAIEKTEVSTTAKGGITADGIDITESEKNRILKEYLKTVAESRQKALILDGSGVGVKAPVSRPKTITEAGILAKQILQNEN